MVSTIIYSTIYHVHNLFYVLYFRYVLENAMKVLRNAAGNLYINDKSTGSVVGQQPFGGSRQSGITIIIIIKLLRL